MIVGLLPNLVSLGVDHFTSGTWDLGLSDACTTALWWNDMLPSGWVSKLPSADRILVIVFRCLSDKYDRFQMEGSLSKRHPASERQPYAKVRQARNGKRRGNASGNVVRSMCRSYKCLPEKMPDQHQFVSFYGPTKQSRLKFVSTFAREGSTANGVFFCGFQVRARLGVGRYEFCRSE